MAVLSAETVAQILYQAGFRGEDLVKMTAIGRRESGYKTDAWRTDSPGKGTGDVGLFQINHENLPALRQIGVTSMQQLLDPVTNARAAHYLWSQHGYFPWGMGRKPGGGVTWTAGGDPLMGTNMDAARAAVEGAAAAGLLGQPYQGGVGGVPTNPSGQGSLSQTVKLPSDTQVVRIDGTMDIYATYDVGGVRLAYKVDLAPGAANWKDFPLQVISQEQWNQNAYIQAGDSGELGTVQETFTNFRQFWDSIMARVMGANNPARHDPEVMRVVAELAARPDMTDAELQNKLQQTQWFQTRTTAELEWNGLSEAEQNKRREETKARALDTIFQYFGAQVDETDPRVTNYLEQLASGKMGWGAYSTLMRQQAQSDPNSPASRERQRAEEEARQRPIDIENTAQNIRQTLDRWGLAWTNNEIMKWAKDVVEKRASDDDLMNVIQTQSATLYPWKDPKMETRQAAQPWLETFERVLEKPGTLNDPRVKKALTMGQTAWDFEQELKKSDQWLTTRNARTQLVEAGAEIGRRMGFH